MKVKNTLKSFGILSVLSTIIATLVLSSSVFAVVPVSGGGSSNASTVTPTTLSGSQGTCPSGYSFTMGDKQNAPSCYKSNPTSQSDCPSGSKYQSGSSGTSAGLIPSKCVSPGDKPSSNKDCPVGASFNKATGFTQNSCFFNATSTDCPSGMYFVKGDNLGYVANSCVSGVSKPRNQADCTASGLLYQSGTSSSTASVAASCVQPSAAAVTYCKNQSGSNLISCEAGYSLQDCSSFTGGDLSECKTAEAAYNSQNDGSNGSSNEASCSNGFSLAWILCSVISGAANLLNNMYQDIIAPVLDQPQSSTMLDSSQPYYKVWSNFRIYGDIILVIALLVVVFGESIGGGLIDAYSAKKILPRLLVSAVLVNLSIYLIAIALDVTSVLGHGIYNLFVLPFDSSIHGFSLHLDIFGDLFTMLSSGVGLIWIATAGGGFLHFFFVTVLGSAALILFSTMITLVLRVALILGLLFVSPVAFALYCLPNTEQYFRKWWNLLFRALLVYPIVGAIFALANITALTLSNLPLSGAAQGFAETIGLFGLFAPLVLIPFAFRMAGGAIGAIHDGIGGRVQSAGMRGIAGVRARRRQELHERRMGGEGRLGSGRAGALYRGVATLGQREGWTPTRRGREQFRAYNQKVIGQMGDKKLEEGGARAFSDDNVSAVLARGLSGRAAIQAITNQNNPVTGQNYTEQEAQAAISRAEVATGLTAGSDAMLVAAQKYRTAMSATAYTGDEAGHNAQRDDLQNLIQRGLITQEDAASWMKSNRSRSDYSANGWAGTNDFLAGRTTAADQLRGAFNGADTRDIMSNHQMGVDAMAEQARLSLEAAFQPGGTNEQRDRAMAAIGNIHNILSSTSPNKAAAFADNVLNSATLTQGANITLRRQQRDADNNLMFTPRIDDQTGEVVRRNGRDVMDPVMEEYAPTMGQYIDTEVRANARDHQLFHTLERNYASAREAAANAGPEMMPQGEGPAGPAGV